MLCFTHMQDFNEVTHHLLEAIYVHLLNTRPQSDTAVPMTTATPSKQSFLPLSTGARVRERGDVFVCPAASACVHLQGGGLSLSADKTYNLTEVSIIRRSAIQNAKYLCAGNIDRVS
jgi:hypothetical protein